MKTQSEFEKRTDWRAGSYENGRSSGYADGAHDFEWGRGSYHSRELEVLDDARVGREMGASQNSRAWLLGFARGYRDAIGKGERT